MITLSAPACCSTTRHLALQAAHLVQRRHGAGTQAGLAGHVQRVLDDVDLITAQVTAALRHTLEDCGCTSDVCRQHRACRSCLLLCTATGAYLAQGTNVWQPVSAQTSCSDRCATTDIESFVTAAATAWHRTPQPRGLRREPSGLGAGTGPGHQTWGPKRQQQKIT